MNLFLLFGLAILVIINGLQLVHSLRSTGRYAGFPNPSAVLNLLAAGSIGYGVMWE